MELTLLPLTRGKPKLMNIKEFISSFVEFREEVITGRTRFDLDKARDRAHVLIGLAIAVSNVDKIIEIIKKSKDPNTAKIELLKNKWSSKELKGLLQLVDDPRQIKNDKEIYLTEDQAKAVLELRLQRLTGLGQDEIRDELEELSKKINDYLEILSNRRSLLKIIEKELLEVKKEFSTDRKTEIRG